MQYQAATVAGFYLSCATVTVLSRVQQGVAAERAQRNCKYAAWWAQAAGPSSLHELSELLDATVAEKVWVGLASHTERERGHKRVS